MRHVVKGVSIIRKVALPAYLMASVLFYTCKIAHINVRLFAAQHIPSKAFIWPSETSFTCSVEIEHTLPQFAQLSSHQPH